MKITKIKCIFHYEKKIQKQGPTNIWCNTKYEKELAYSFKIPPPPNIRYNLDTWPIIL